MTRFFLRLLRRRARSGLRRRLGFPALLVLAGLSVALSLTDLSGILDRHVPALGPIAETLASGAGPARPAQAAGLTGTPRVTDGDTIALGGEDIRLHGIDAPESAQRCYRDGQALACGQSATRYLRELVAQGPVSCTARTRDRYGRVIGVCYVDAPSGRFDANAAMVEAGMAMAYRRYSGDYVPAETRARRAGRGIWSTEFQAPWDWRRNN